MPRHGHARVSSTDQDCALQKARLHEAGCDVIRAERVSGPGTMTHANAVAFVDGSEPIPADPVAEGARSGMASRSICGRFRSSAGLLMLGERNSTLSRNRLRRSDAK